MTSGPTSSCHCPPSHLLEHLDDFPIVVLWLIALNRQRHRHHIQFAVLPVFCTGSRRIRKCATYIVEEAEVLDVRIVVSLIHVQPHEVVVFIPANGVYKTRKRLTLKLPLCDDLQFNSDSHRDDLPLSSQTRYFCHQKLKVVKFITWGRTVVVFDWNRNQKVIGRLGAEHVSRLSHIVRAGRLLVGDPDNGFGAQINANNVIAIIVASRT